MRCEAVQVIVMAVIAGLTILWLSQCGLFTAILGYNNDVEYAKDSIQYDEQLSEKLHREYDGSWNDIVKALS